jgi:hypothetical protein
MTGMSRPWSGHDKYRLDSFAIKHKCHVYKNSCDIEFQLFQIVAK